MKTPKMRGGITCPTHGKLSYTTRKVARHWGRVFHRSESVGEYYCEPMDSWHIGHHPEALRHGIIDRDDHAEGVRKRMERIKDLKTVIHRLEVELFQTRSELETYRYLEQVAEEALVIIRGIRAALEGADDGVRELSRPGMPEPGDRQA